MLRVFDICPGDLALGGPTLDSTMGVPVSQSGRPLHLALEIPAQESQGLRLLSLLLCAPHHNSLGHTTFSSGAGIFCSQPHQPDPQHL